MKLFLVIYVFCGVVRVIWTLHMAVKARVVTDGIRATGYRELVIFKTQTITIFPMTKACLPAKPMPRI